MGGEARDKRLELSEKSPSDCLKYLGLLVKVLAANESENLELVTKINDSIQEIPRTKVDEISKLSIEELAKRKSDDSVANLVKSINNLRSSIGNANWLEWGKRIRDHRNLEKYTPLKTTTHTRAELYDFLVSNKELCKEKFGDLIARAESQAAVNRAIKEKVFENILGTTDLPKERFFDDLQCSLVLEMAQRYIANQRESEELIRKLSVVSNEVTQLKSELDKANGEVEKYKGKLINIKRLAEDMDIRGLCEPLKDGVKIVTAKRKGSPKAQLKEFLRELE